MPLDDEYADRVSFECQECRLEHSLRHLRKRGGECSKCGSLMWSMVTEYNERKEAHGILPLLAHAVLGIELISRNARTTRVETPRVSADEALAIARAGILQYQRLAFRYMEFRRQVDGEQDRETMREHGGRNCAVCDMFYMPAPEKAWTQESCCSKACRAKLPGQDHIVFQSAPTTLPTAEKPAPAVVVTCRCSFRFDVLPMYIGAYRPCPRCGEKTIVPEGPLAR